MELTLTRSYYKGGTNGTLYCEGKKLCHTVELPWRNNKPCFSCIPEGRYLLERTRSPKFGEHLLVKDVPGRRLILLHPANNAIQELLGCIAPVTELTGEGKGNDSAMAVDLLYRYVAKSRERAWLVIRSNTGPVSAPYTLPLLPRLAMAV
jgi:hypothetical protein